MDGLWKMGNIPWTGLIPLSLSQSIEIINEVYMRLVTTDEQTPLDQVTIYWIDEFDSDNNECDWFIICIKNIIMNV